MSDKTNAPVDEAELPPQLRFLKTLVTVLAGVMIAGLLAVIALLVIRFSAPMAGAPALPATIALPEGEQARAVTFGPGWVAVVTQSDKILVLDAETGALRQSLQIAPPQGN